jgi:hypothetical protein
MGAFMKRFFILPLLFLSFAVLPIMSMPVMQQDQTAQAKKTVRKKSRSAVTARRVRRPQARAGNQNAQSSGKVVSTGPIHANTRTRIYYWPNCPDFNKVPLRSRMIFGTSEEAEKAGYKAATNCPQ